MTLSGGSIDETNTTFVGSYTCKVSACASFCTYIDMTFTFPLNMLSTATVPDPPTALTEITSSTTSTSVGFSWSQPANDGGSPITGYSIWWDQGNSVWIVYNPNYTGSTSLNVPYLTDLKTYKF